MRITARSAIFVLAALAAHEGAALACGCMANPTVVPTSPVIQAGERILFFVDSGQVTATIQIAFNGDAAEFGWLLPLPSVPTLEPGTEELFAALEPATTPTFQLNRTSTCRSHETTLCVGFGGDASLASFTDAGAGAAADLGFNPLLVADSVGPYDYAVLKADDKAALVEWLAQNRFVVPVTSDAALLPYIHPGAYFLALKLKPGKGTRDIQPITVRYASDLPMIPITLTSIGATPDMDILVWLLGTARAIPRNYHHTVLDEFALDWNGARNYKRLLVRAVAEAPDHHTFITEYAGSPAQAALPIVHITLDAAALRAKTDPVDFALALRATPLAYPFAATLRAVLAAHIAEPAELVKERLSADDFYGQIDFHLQGWRARYPDAPPLSFDAAAAADEVMKRVIKPHNDAGLWLRRFPYLTRLHTALSPADMNADPVFSFNPDLPQVGTAHIATLENDCDGQHFTTSAGRLDAAHQINIFGNDSLPASLRIERLRERGEPEAVVDNRGSLVGGASGCTVGDGGRTRKRVGSLLLITLAIVASRRRARRAGPTDRAARA